MAEATSYDDVATEAETQDARETATPAATLMREATAMEETATEDNATEEAETTAREKATTDAQAKEP